MDIDSGADSFFNLDNENSVTEDYTVKIIFNHPKFDPKRYTDDITLLILERPIQLSSKSGVNAACYPQCKIFFFQILWKSRCHIWITFPSHLKKLHSTLRF